MAIKGGTGKIKMDVILIFFGLLYPAFQLFYNRGRHDDSEKKGKLKELKKYTNNVFNWEKYFVVITVYQFIAFFLNYAFNSFTTYSVIKGFIVFYLVRQEARYAAKVFDSISGALCSYSPFIMEFADNALNEKSGFEYQTKIFFAHIADIFRKEYNSILSSIQIEYPH